MPGAWTEPAVDATALAQAVQRGGSRYVRVPADWPAGAHVRLLLLPRADAVPTPGSPPAPVLALPAEAPRP